MFENGSLRDFPLGLLVDVVDDELVPLDYEEFGAGVGEDLAEDLFVTDHVPDHLQTLPRRELPDAHDLARQGVH